MNLSVRFGGRIRKMRKMLNISQEELADLSGLNRSHMGEIERGQASPTLITIDRIAAALNCSIAQLMDDNPSHYPSGLRGIDATEGTPRYAFKQHSRL